MHLRGRNHVTSTDQHYEMKALKIVLLAALTATGLAIPAVRAADDAAPAPAPAHRQRGQMSPAAYVERLDKAVGGLTDDQKTKITDIVTANQEKAKAATTREERMDIMKGQHDQIRAVLTADQQAKFDAMPMRGRGGNRGGKKKAEQE